MKTVILTIRELDQLRSQRNLMPPVVFNPDPGLGDRAKSLAALVRASNALETMERKSQVKIRRQHGD